MLKKGFKQQNFRMSDKAVRRLAYLALTMNMTKREVLERAVGAYQPRYDMTISFECLPATGYNVSPERYVDLCGIVAAYLSQIDPTFVQLPRVIEFELRNTYGVGDLQAWQYDRETDELRRT